jgi:hypothetical protein
MNIIESEFYFAAGNRHTPRPQTTTANIHRDSKAIKVKILSLLKRITVSEIMVIEWVDEKAIGIIVNPQKLRSDGQLANVIPVVTPGSATKQDGSDGGHLGTTPDIPIKVPGGTDTPEAGLSPQDILNGLFTLNGYGGHSNVNLPGDPAASGFGDAVGALVTGLAAGVHKLVEVMGAAAEDPNDALPAIPVLAEAAAAAIFFEVVAGAAAVAAVAYAYDQIMEAAKTPRPDDISDGRKTTVVLGTRPTAPPIKPAVDNILEEQDEPTFVLKQRNQAVDPNPDENLPQLGGDVIMIFTTSQGVTDPQHDKTVRVIGTFVTG